MKVLPTLVLVATVATAQQFGFSNNNYNRFNTGLQGNFFNRFENNQFLNHFNNQYQDNYYRQNENRFQQEQRYQVETSQHYDNEPLGLPSGASYLLGDISSSFSCADRPYGYYADVDNYCRVFHVCNPSIFPDGTVQTYQYSMMCGENTQFDQRAMTCVEQTVASPCQDAPSFYWINESFGLPHEKL